MILKTDEALRLLLDQVDYTKGACDVTEMIGACLPREVITRCYESLAAHEQERMKIGKEG